MNEVNVMKRFDFTKKHNICAVCFVIVMVLTCILCYTFPVVHAEESLTLSDFYYIDEFLDKSTASSLNGNSGYYDVPSGIFASDSQLIYDNPMEFYEAIKSIFNDPDVITLFDSTYSFWRQSGTTNAISDITFCHNTDGTLSLMLNDGYVSIDYDNMQNYKFRNPSSYYGSTIYRFDWNGSKLVYNRYYNGGSYTSCQDIDGYIASTSPMNMYYPSYYQNLNYVLIDGKVGKGSGGISGIEAPYPDETASNNLVLSQADYIFTHQTYYAPYSSEINTGSATPVGTITFKGQPNEYQIAHPEQFTVRLRFHFDYNVDYMNWNTSEFGYFKRTSQILKNQKNLKMGLGNAQYDIPMTTFIQNKNSVDLVIKDVFDTLSSNGNTLTGLLAQSKEVTSISYNDFLLTCYANIVSGEEVSGAYIENYNFNSRKGLTTNKDIENNKNPYISNPIDQADDDPDTTNITPKPNVPGPGGSDDNGGGSTSNNTTTTNGNGSIVINNNPTFNNNPSASASGGGSSGGTTPNESAFNFYTIFNPVSFFTNLLVDKNKATASNLQEATGINAWFQIVNTTYTFIPQQVWTILLACLGAFISITLIAFIIRIILDLL